MNNIEKVYIKKTFVFLLILCLGVGFAFLTSNLTITGNTSVSGNKWNVYFDNIEVLDGSVAAQLPSIDTNKTTVNFLVELATPGDKYEFTVDAVNDGTIDAMVETIGKSNLEENMAKLFTYTVTYLDGSELKKGDVLQYGESVTYKVSLELKRDIKESDLFDSDMDLELFFSVDYIQSDKEHIASIIYGEFRNFDYTGGVQEFIASEDGDYKLEVWGAQGGKESGYGGYATGDISMLKNQKLYIVVGGTTANAYGGYNGGGDGNVTTVSSANAAGGGGGATHIAIANNRGVLKNYENNKEEVLIVAGGGGGKSETSNDGGAGGGYIGNDGLSTSNYQGYGGTQDSTGARPATTSSNTSLGGFGYGGHANELKSASSERMFAGGAGGGFYGGSGGDWSTAAGVKTGSGGGGGGSGYIGNTLLSEKVMYCYNCKEPDENDENYVNIKTISTTNVSQEAISQYAKQGNGYARISFPTNSTIDLGDWKKTENSVDITNYQFDNKKGKLSFVTSLANTTEYAEFTFNVINKMDMDCYIKNVFTSKFDDTKISYTIMYDNFNISESNKLLDGNTRKTVTVRIQLLEESAAFSNQEFFILLNFAKAEKAVDFIGKSWNFSYIAKEEVFEVPFDGNYKLEVWGAQGGSAQNVYSYPAGGYGSYSVGVINIRKDNTLYINVGGKATDVFATVAGTAGGYNGGGSGGTGKDARYPGGAGGGGATHIALDSGLLQDLSAHATDNRILIVAGGGGGAIVHISDLSYPGGHAGGMSGNAGRRLNKSSNVSGGTQTTGYSFGKGQNGADGNGADWGQSGRGGGGGGYYGGFASQIGVNGAASGGGGSGYIGNEKLTEKSMYCYECTEPSTADENYENIKTISITNVSDKPIEKYAKKGNGYATITYLGE